MLLLPSSRPQSEAVRRQHGPSADGLPSPLPDRSRRLSADSTGRPQAAFPFLPTAVGGVWGSAPTSIVFKKLQGTFLKTVKVLQHFQYLPFSHTPIFAQIRRVGFFEGDGNPRAKTFAGCGDAFAKARKKSRKLVMFWQTSCQARRSEK